MVSVILACRRLRQEYHKSEVKHINSEILSQYKIRYRITIKPKLDKKLLTVTLLKFSFVKCHNYSKVYRVRDVSAVYSTLYSANDKH